MANDKRNGSPKSQLSRLLRAPRGHVDVTRLDTNSAPGYPGEGKEDADEHVAAIDPELSDLQEKLFAHGRANPDRAPRILVVLQGMDAAGKGGVLRHAIGLVDPHGVQHKAFKAPTKEELAHHYLWRVERELPAPGMIGVFDRSHYEDVLVVRVEELVPEAVWSQRYDEINAWEQELVDDGITLIKCFLHLSKDEQKKRLTERVENPEKYWKHNPGDIDVRLKWDQYMEAYSALLTRCNTAHAPWYVIPSDKKWYKNWAVAELLREHLAGLHLSWPGPDFDVEVERRRVRES